MKLPSDFTFEKYGLSLRFVNDEDADFIIKLRTDPKLGRFINSTSNDVELQKVWIKEYKKRESENKDYYFIFFENGIPVGLNRIYNIQDNQFTTGSWIFDPFAPDYCSIASALIVRIIAFEFLDLEIERSFDGCHVDNKKVLKFNLMLGLKINGYYETPFGKFCTFDMSKEDFYQNKNKIESILIRMK